MILKYHCSYVGYHMQVNKYLIFFIKFLFLSHLFYICIQFSSIHELPFGIPYSSKAVWTHSPIMTHLSAPWHPTDPGALWVPGDLLHQHAQGSRCHLGVREDQGDQVCLAVRPLQTLVSSDWQPTGPTALKNQRPNAVMSVDSPQLIFISFIHWFCSCTH